MPRAALRPLTLRTLVVSVGTCALLALLIILITPLFGVIAETSGRAVVLLDLGEVWRGITGPRTVEAQIFLLDRLPRTLAGAVVGAGLAAAGAVLQAALRNPLAEPFTLGISSGSALAAVIAIRLGIDTTFLGDSGIGLAALVGAGCTIYLVWRLGRMGSAHPPATLLLAGITIAMFCSAASMAVQYTADFSEVYRIVRWMMGGLDWIRYGTLSRVAVAILIGLVILLRLGRDLNGMSAGSDAAASVGVDPHKTMGLAFVTASLVVGAGIALAGPIGFIGLMVPHAVRAVVGPDHRVLLPASMFVGAGALVLCDTVSRMVIAPSQLPVGVVTALLGGPFFLYLLLREKSRARLWG